MGDVLGEALVVVLGEHRGTGPEGEESVSYFVILVRTFKLLEYIKKRTDFFFLIFFLCMLSNNYLFKVTFEMLNKTSKNCLKFH